MKRFLCFLLLITSAFHSTIIAQSPDDVKINLPIGFTSQVIGKNLDRTRHIVVNSNGDIYIKNSRVRNGGGIVRLRDKNGDGKIDDTTRFGNYGGTGIAIKNGYLYASSNSAVYRYKMNNNEPDTSNPETIVSGLLDIVGLSRPANSLLSYMRDAVSMSAYSRYLVEIAR